MGPQKTPNNQNNLRKNKVAGILISSFKLYHKAIVIKTLWYWCTCECAYTHACAHTHTHTPINRTESPEINLGYDQFIYSKRGKNIQWEKVSSISGAGKLDSDMEKNETGPEPYTIHKKYTQMIKVLNV